MYSKIPQDQGNELPTLKEDPRRKMQHESMIHRGGEYDSLPSALTLVSSLLALLVPLMVGIGLGMFIAGSRRKASSSSSSSSSSSPQEYQEEIKTQREEQDIVGPVTAMALSYCGQEAVRKVHTAGNNKKGPMLRQQPRMKEDAYNVSAAAVPNQQLHNLTLQPPQSGLDNAYVRESGLLLEEVPKHIAVIMDGNRRYGRGKYNCANRGHLDGSKTLVEFSKWCLAEGIQIVTVYAFSTENWNRCPSEINSLMNILCTYCDELRLEAQKRGIRVQVWSTDSERIPTKVALGMRKLVEESKDGDQLVMNVCLSYGSRGEIINACKDIVKDVQNGVMSLNDITEASFESKLLTRSCPDPDIVIRTSGEFRLSNFLLWQIAYSEMFFLNKTWPEVTKEDFLCVIRQYARERKRRFGK